MKYMNVAASLSFSSIFYADGPVYRPDRFIDRTGLSTGPVMDIHQLIYNTEQIIYIEIIICLLLLIFRASAELFCMIQRKNYVPDYDTTIFELCLLLAKLIKYSVYKNRIYKILYYFSTGGTHMQNFFYYY